jgi:hypothetical protein
MKKPPIEVADIIRAAGKDFTEKQRSWMTGLHRKVLSAARPRSAVTGIVVPGAVKAWPSPTTAAAIGIARSV